LFYKKKTIIIIDMHNAHQEKESINNWDVARDYYILY
jgi:hypothetical protein